MWMCVNIKCHDNKWDTENKIFIDNQNTCSVHNLTKETTLSRRQIINSYKRKSVDEKP